MKRVISVSLYGDNPFYLDHALSFLERAKKRYPDWIVRYYVDRETVPREVVDGLRLGGTEIVLKTKKYGGSEGMFWRFLAADDPTVDTYIIRDIDSLIGKRDRQAVDEWLENEKNFHLIRDCWHHGTEILGGLWGGRKQIAGMEDIVEKFLKKSAMPVKVDADQIFLKTEIYPKIRRDLHIHSSYVRYFFEHVFPCPPHDQEEPHMGWYKKDKKTCKEAERHLAAHQQKSWMRKQLDIDRRLPAYLTPRFLEKPYRFGTKIIKQTIKHGTLKKLFKMADYFYVRFCLCPKSKEGKNK